MKLGGGGSVLSREASRHLSSGGGVGGWGSVLTREASRHLSREGSVFTREANTKAENCQWKWQTKHG